MWPFLNLRAIMTRVTIDNNDPAENTKLILGQDIFFSQT